MVNAVATAGSLGLPQLTIPESLRSAADHLRQSSKREKVLGATLAGSSVAAVGGIVAGPVFLAYTGLLAFSIVSNSIPVPFGGSAVLVSASAMLNPFTVALLMGVGGALGKIPGYALGRSSRKMRKSRLVPARFGDLAQRHMGISILVLSIVPNPLTDVIGVAAGRTHYPCAASWCCPASARSRSPWPSPTSPSPTCRSSAPGSSLRQELADIGRTLRRAQGERKESLSRSS